MPIPFEPPDPDLSVPEGAPEDDDQPDAETLALLSQAWVNRIVDHGSADPSQLLAHPDNFAIHPLHQQRILEGALDRLGWIRPVIVNRVTGHVISGHLRVQLALRRDETSIPVDYVELDPEEEAAVLATFDPIGLMAETRSDDLAALLETLRSEQPGYQSELQELRALLLPAPEEVDHIASALTEEDEVAASIRLFYFQIPAEQYSPIVAALDRAMAAFGVETHAEAVARLVNDAYEELSHAAS